MVAIDRHGNIFYEEHKVSAEKSAGDFLTYLKNRDEPPTEVVSEREDIEKQVSAPAKNISSGSQSNGPTKKRTKKVSKAEEDKTSTSNTKKKLKDTKRSTSTD